MPSDFGAFGSFGDFSSSPLSQTIRPLGLSNLPADLIVIIKNLQKRDATTKSKALQDLHVKISQGLDETTIENLQNIWVGPLHRSAKFRPYCTPPWLPISIAKYGLRRIQSIHQSVSLQVNVL